MELFLFFSMVFGFYAGKTLSKEQLENTA